MKLLYKIFGILLVVLIFNSLGFVKAETLEDLASNINDIKEEINSLESSDIKESIAIDKALQELDKVMEFVDESVNNGDVDGAISTLEFMETSLKDVSSFVPKDYISEKIEVGKEFSKEEMGEITEITEGIKKNKKKKLKKLATNMQKTHSKGFNTLEISKNINDLGIKTVSAQDVLEVMQDSSRDLNKNLDPNAEILQNKVVSLKNKIEVNTKIITPDQAAGREYTQPNFAFEKTKLFKEAVEKAAKFDPLEAAKIEAAKNYDSAEFKTLSAAEATEAAKVTAGGEIYTPTVNDPMSLTDQDRAAYYQEFAEEEYARQIQTSASGIEFSILSSTSAADLPGAREAAEAAREVAAEATEAAKVAATEAAEVAASAATEAAKAAAAEVAEAAREVAAEAAREVAAVSRSEIIIAADAAFVEAQAALQTMQAEGGSTESEINAQKQKVLNTRDALEKAKEF